MCGAVSGCRPTTAVVGLNTNTIVVNNKIIHNRITLYIDYFLVFLKKVELRYCAKFCRNSSNRGTDMSIFRFFKMATATILQF